MAERVEWLAAEDFTRPLLAASSATRAALTSPPRCVAVDHRHGSRAASCSGPAAPRETPAVRWCPVPFPVVGGRTPAAPVPTSHPPRRRRLPPVLGDEQAARPRSRRDTR